MQIKVFTVPIIGGEAINEELNVFLRSRKILQVEQQMVHQEGSAFWTFSVKFLDDPQFPTDRDRVRVDYRQVLDETCFARFSKLREIRKELAKEDGVPAYAIFTDEELSGLAKIEELTAASMRSVKGIGEKKVEKYGPRMLAQLAKA